MRLNWRLAAPLTTGMLVTGLALAGCATGVAATDSLSAAHPASASPAHTTSVPPASVPSTSVPSTSAPAHPSPAHPSPARARHARRTPASANAQAANAQAAAAKPLAGKTVGIDPGHNGRNKDRPDLINKIIWNGRENETCDTTGTQTDGGYTEAQFNFNVARYLRADLRNLGARVVFTRRSNNGVGPCVNRRAWILNRAHSSVAIDIHADGGPASGRGFTVLEPVRDGPNNKVIGSSVRFGSDVRTALLKYTRMPVSNYYGHDGVIFRDDLAGLNLTTEPKILIETGNMRNATDASLLQAAWFQKRLAVAFTHAIVTFLTRR
jgi:N-acetylmuramoyl-L-alanine amidase